MNNPYNPPLIEKWVSKTFVHAGLIYPSDLRANKICKAFNIEYGHHFGIAGSRMVGNDSFIVTDERLQLPEQHEQFLHELGHILRHDGDQCNMPQMLREYQEWDAELFSMYAAIPFHMIDFGRPHTVHSIMEEFKVTKATAFKRMGDIQQKSYWAERRKHESKRSSPKQFLLKNCSSETQRIMNQLASQLAEKGASYEIKSLL
ncbi:ImmA/IrrE family metallo-endopeptidase [Sporolactobacillus laevolacticus]|uniref:IrrE N-terminal-like domain-containing protein n=1 Tax=Sporolactobacillus laevolacticus DSM 442 TaxID=1395513 RepID=V6J5P8_9BACL|nr:ImmA/IrrE family metallo-endopeptidase [Sporolactobacillus laevolacticus]EST12074.1 hypothetical protein P343_08225 [Sporolactobacillus laevolacticus DSM 442]